mmetsp:Transcript_24103/g.65728  ORF Transcript_24103/g.65728 Transcript_24103/m.65728 type:complete len:232 (+) Transcript_24103:533-1228(+)
MELLLWNCMSRAPTAATMLSQIFSGRLHAALTRSLAAARLAVKTCVSMSTCICLSCSLSWSAAMDALPGPSVTFKCCTECISMTAAGESSSFARLLVQLKLPAKMHMPSTTMVSKEHGRQPRGAGVSFGPPSSPPRESGSFDCPRSSIQGQGLLTRDDGEAGPGLGGGVRVRNSRRSGSARSQWPGSLCSRVSSGLGLRPWGLGLALRLRPPASEAMWWRAGRGRHSSGAS